MSLNIRLHSSRQILSGLFYPSEYNRLSQIESVLANNEAIMHKSVDLSEFLCSDRGEQWVRFPPRNWIRASLHSAVVYREERVKFKEQRGTCDDCHALRSSLIPSPTLICTTYLLPQNLVTSSLLVSLISPLVDVCGEHVDLSLLALCGCVTGCILCTQLVL